MDQGLLHALVQLRDRTYQKNRIAFGNRLDAIHSGRDEAEPETIAIIERHYSRFKDLEEEVTSDIEEIVGDSPIIHAMCKVKGIGKTLAAKLIAPVDIHEARYVSSLWKYAGYAVMENGRADRPVKGQRLGYNKWLKTTCYQIGVSFLKSRSPYTKIYEKAKARYEVDRPDWVKIRRHHAAMRKMIKVFLSHLWVVWRRMEDLPISEPYILAQDNKHTHYYDPRNFGWELDDDGLPVDW
jgi:hypothetical protein